MRQVNIGGLDAFAVVAILVASLTTVALTTNDASGQTTGPDSEVTATLYASFVAPRGWSTSPGAEAEPGPTITVDVGEYLTLTLTSEDGLTHAFWVDYDAGSGASPDIDPGEPFSPTFSTAPVTYTFVARNEGHFTYYDADHYPAMFGTLVARAPPVIVLRDPILGTSLTGGAPQVIDFDVLDASPLNEITLWLNYSYNGGEGGTIAGPIQAGPDPNHVPWTPPRVNATDAVMNITAIDPDGRVGYHTSSFEIDSAPPRAVSVSPAPGATDASVVGVQVSWSEDMNYNTISPRAVGLWRTRDGAWVQGSYVITGSDMEFFPDRPLARLTEYEAVINATATDFSRPGNTAIPTSWRFTTANDTTPPGILEMTIQPAQVPPGHSVDVDVHASDDRAVFRVYAHIVGPGTDVNYSLQREDDLWSFWSGFETAGAYNVTVWVVDAGGNFVSQEGTFEVIAPPSPTPLPTIALAIAAAAIIVSVLFWMIRRRRRTGGLSE